LYLRFTKGQISKLIKGLFVSIILISLFLFLRQTNLEQVASYLSAMGHGYLYIILVTFIAMTMGTIAWRYTFEEDIINKVSFSRLFIIRLVGENIGLLNPSNIIGGDTYKGYQLSKEGIPYHKSTSSLVLSRMIMMVTQILTFIIAGSVFTIIVQDSNQLKWIIFGSILLLIVLTIATYGLLRFGLVSSKVHGLIAKLGWNSLIYKFRKIYVQLRCFYRDQRQRFLKAIGFNILNWLIGSLEFWLIFYFVSAQISVLDALLVDQGVLVLKSFGAFIPGQLGIEEFSNKMMLSIVGVKAAGLWVAASIIRRSRQIFWIAVSGLLYLLIRRHRPSNVTISTIR